MYMIKWPRNCILRALRIFKTGTVKECVRESQNHDLNSSRTTLLWLQMSLGDLGQFDETLSEFQQTVLKTRRSPPTDRDVLLGCLRNWPHCTRQGWDTGGARRRQLVEMVARCWQELHMGWQLQVAHISECGWFFFNDPRSTLVGWPAGLLSFFLVGLLPGFWVAKSRGERWLM